MARKEILQALMKERLPAWIHTLGKAEEASKGAVPGGNTQSKAGAGSTSTTGGKIPKKAATNGPSQIVIPAPERFQVADRHANYVDGVQIWKMGPNEKPEALKPGDPLFDITAAAIVLGYDIMDTPIWRKKMMAHARVIFEIIEREGLPLPPGRCNTAEAIKDYVEDFINRCRSDNPCAILNNLGGTLWARTLKLEWSGRGTFNPKISATVEHNIQVRRQTTILWNPQNLFSSCIL